MAGAAAASRRSLLRWFAICFGAMVLALCSAIPAAAQTDFPSRPITIVVPFPPGGSADAVMRLVAEKLAHNVKQPVIIDNRPGGGGNIGAVFVKQAAPDGYTLFMGHNGIHAINPALYPDLRFDPVKDFQPITTIMSFPNILVVPAVSPANSVAELAALAKSMPAGLSFASQGVGASGHLHGEMFKRRIGAPMVHVPYRGAVAAITDLITGRVDLMFVSYLSAGAQIRDGKLRMLAVSAVKRSSTIPEVPTMTEAGFPGFEMETWFGILAPAATPEPVVRTLHAEFVRAARHPDVERLLTTQAADLITSTPEAFATFIASEMARLGEIVRDTGIKAE
jgi:tripartite-type tricarboxylate transporter receptor subunit TctC